MSQVKIVRARRLLLVTGLLALTLPVLAQDRPQPSAAAPTTPPPAETTAPPAQEPAPAQRPRPRGEEAIGEIDSVIAEVRTQAIPAPPPAVELPEHARRDPNIVGALDPVQLGLGDNPWGGASGAFLSTLMRRMDTPLASRWVHIALRNAVLAETHAPRNVHPVDWVAERAWLLLRMGEADGARLLVSGVDVDQFTPKMFQVALQSALANADPSGLCPLEEGLVRVERRVHPMVQAMCAALAGEPESAAAQIDNARRRGQVSGIDLELAQKVVGAGTNTGRAVTIEWGPVQELNTWRFGLATATGMTFPDRLTNNAPPRLRAWQARAPLLSPQQRLASARIATGLGVVSSQALLDLYSIIYDSTDAEELGGTDAWQLRLAFAGRTEQARLEAMRRLWAVGQDPLEREASRALLARAAARFTPDAELEADAGNLIASMLAAGLDREAAAWVPVVNRIDNHNGDSAWAMLALAAPDTNGLDVSAGRVNAFITRDTSPGRKRSALLVAGLAGLGRLDLDAADRLNSRHNLGLDRRSRWTRVIDSSAALGQPATVLLLTGTGFQTSLFEQLPSAHLYHSVAALRRTGQDFTARMIAAEALSRT